MIEWYRRWYDRHLDRMEAGGQHQTETAPRPPFRGGCLIAALLIVFIAVYVGSHVLSAESSKGSPPAACQLVGGHWDLWNGWRCG